MSVIQLLFLTVGLPFVSVATHEITHLVVARAICPISVGLTSCVPFRLQVEFHDTPSTCELLVVALAPILVGSMIAVLSIQTGSWRQLRQINPYYLYYLIGLNWLLYIFPSPADLRLAVQPRTEELSDKGMA